MAGWIKVEMAHQFFSYLLCTSMDNRQQTESRDQYERSLSRLKNRDNIHAAIQAHTQSGVCNKRQRHATND
ncbi:MAG: hypothetical protein WAT12_09025 [Candidatus Nitrotoga sp.]